METSLYIFYDFFIKFVRKERSVLLQPSFLRTREVRARISLVAEPCRCLSSTVRCVTRVWRWVLLIRGPSCPSTLVWSDPSVEKRDPLETDTWDGLISLLRWVFSVGTKTLCRKCPCQGNDPIVIMDSEFYGIDPSQN